MGTDFVMPCPACRRYNQIPLRSLGERITCQHCRRTMVARDPESESLAMQDLLKYHALLTPVGESESDPRVRPR